MKTGVDTGFVALKSQIAAVAARESVELRPLQFDHCGTIAVQPDAARKRGVPAFGDPPRLFLSAAEKPSDAPPEEGQEPPPPGAAKNVMRLEEFYDTAIGKKKGLLEEWTTNLGVSVGRVALLIRRIVTAVRSAGSPSSRWSSPDQIPDVVLACLYLFSCEPADLRDMLKTVVPKPPKAPKPAKDPDDPDAAAEEAEPEPEPEPDAGEGDGGEGAADGSEGIPGDEVPEELPDMRKEVTTALRGTDEEAPKLQEKWAVTIAALFVGASQPFKTSSTLHRVFKEPEDFVTAAKALAVGDTAVWGAFTGWSSAPAPAEPEAGSLLVCIDGVPAGADVAGTLSRYSEDEVILPAYSVLTVASNEQITLSSATPAAAEGGEGEAAEGEGGEGEGGAAKPTGQLLKLSCGATLFDEESTQKFSAWMKRVVDDLAQPSADAASIHEWQSKHVERLAKAKQVRTFQRGAVETDEDAGRSQIEMDQGGAWGAVVTELQAQYDAIAHLMAPPPSADAPQDGEGGDGGED